MDIKTEEDIVSKYQRNTTNGDPDGQRNQIHIIAQLTCKDVEDIIAILEKNDCRVPRMKATRRRGRERIEYLELFNEYAELWDKGYPSDQISAMLGLSKTTISGRLKLAREFFPEETKGRRFYGRPKGV